MRTYGLGDQYRNLCLQRKVGRRNVLFTFTAVRQVYQANHQGCSFGGPINTHGELDVYIMWHLQRAWSCLRRYSMEIYDTPGVLLRLRVIMIKAEPIESYYTDAYYGVRTRLFTPAHGRLTTPCSSNALAGGNESAIVTPNSPPMPICRYRRREH